MIQGPELERAALDIFYRTEREWRVIGFWTSLLGAGGFYVGWRGSAALLMALSTLSQIISWRAMRGAHRLEKQRLVRMGAGRP